jgi:hypothetical protein
MDKKILSKIKKANILSPEELTELESAFNPKGETKSPKDKVSEPLGKTDKPKDVAPATQIDDVAKEQPKEPVTSIKKQ